mmetsp:Transcript_20407/g.47748  ORF Transcript_20407/g.47748 Transcript_20407/m.47748 type:complete len:263 (+) Transcript_20407:531-1319(+)
MLFTRVAVMADTVREILVQRADEEDWVARNVDDPQVRGHKDLHRHPIARVLRKQLPAQQLQQRRRAAPVFAKEQCKGALPDLDRAAEDHRLEQAHLAVLAAVAVVVVPHIADGDRQLVYGPKHRLVLRQLCQLPLRFGSHLCMNDLPEREVVGPVKQHGYAFQGWRGRFDTLAEGEDVAQCCTNGSEDADVCQEHTQADVPNEDLPNTEDKVEAHRQSHEPRDHVVVVQEHNPRLHFSLVPLHHQIVHLLRHGVVTVVSRNE